MSFIILNQLHLFKTPTLHSIFIIISLLSIRHTYAQPGYFLQLKLNNTSISQKEQPLESDTSEATQPPAKSNPAIRFSKGNIITAISILLVLVLLIRALKIKRKKIF